MLMMAWLGVEIGLGARAMHQARSASDSIALAAAARVRDGHAVARADALAAAAANRGPNGPVLITIPDGPGGGGDVELGWWDDATRTFTPDVGGGNAARARVRFAADHPNGTSSPVLSGLFGAESMAIERTSVAVHVRARHTTSLLLLAASGLALSLEDASMLSAEGGVSVSSAVQGCIAVAADAALSASVVRTEGSVDAGSAAQVDAPVMEGFDVPVDPFASLALPALDAASAELIAHDNMSVTQVAPGVHQGISISGGSVVLLPGLHQFAGPLEVSGTGTLVLQDATVHLDESAMLSVGGGAAVTGTPSAAGDWAGACVIQRGSSPPWVVGGSGIVELSGVLYAPGVSLQVQDAAQCTADSAILGSLTCSGTSALNLEDDVDALKGVAVPGRARLVR